MSAETKGVEEIALRADGYPDTPFQAWLAERYACDSGRAFVDDSDPHGVWEACDRADWMAWLVRELCVDVAVSNDVWAHVLDLYESDSPDFTAAGIRQLLPVLPDFLAARSSGTR